MRAIARWCAASWPAACLAALIAGLVEGVTMDAPLEVIAGTGFFVLFVLPLVLVLSLLVRVLWRAWQPATLSLDQVAGWIGYAYVASLVLGFIVFRSTHYIAGQTEFRPMVVGFVQPAITITAAFALLALSRPFAMLFARQARRVRLTPLRVVGGAALVVVATVLGAWWWVRPQLGHLDTTPVHAPLVLLVAAVAAHRLVGERRWLRRTVSGLALAVVGVALFAWQARPTVTLSVWGELPVTGVLIDKAFDLDAIRDQVSLDAFRPTAKQGAAHPDIVLITIDTVRADRTPPYGGPAEMPYLRQLSTRGAVFEWAFAPSNVTRRSIPSMLTGIQPNRVRGRVVGWALRVDPRHVMLAERLRAAGYETAGFMCCEGFWGSSARTGLSRGLEHVEIERNGTTLAESASAWIKARDKQPGRRPLFLWMHILEPHNWTNGASEPADVETRRRLYDRSLAASDRMVAEVGAAFSSRTPETVPILIISADHGEALGDHGEPNHSTDLYNAQIRVPFVVVGPGIKPGRITETVSLTDLAPTLIELAGFAPPVTDGRSLAGLLTGARPSADDGLAYAAMIKDRSNPGGVSAVVLGRWKLIRTGDRLELYDIHADPGELTDLAASRPDKVTELHELLRRRETLERSPFE